MASLSAQATEIILVCTVVGTVYSLVWWFLKPRLCCWHENWADHDMENIIEGAKKYFLCTESWYVGVFVVAFAILIFLFLGSVEGFSTQSRPCTYDPSNACKPALATAVFTTVSFLLGAGTSVLSRFLGMKIAINAYATAALEARSNIGRNSIAAFRSCAVLEILVVGNGLLVLYIAINLFKLYYGNDWRGLCEAITGYGLGGSFMALFGRVGGKIYAKAADAAVRLAKKNALFFPDDGTNPVVIADIVGDNAGMMTDLFGSYAESSCAALVVASISSFRIDHHSTAMCYPLLISYMGILVCLITLLFTLDFSEKVKEFKPALRKQLIISTILMTVGIAIVSWVALPSSFTVYNFGLQKVVESWQLVLHVGVGLWAGLAIGFVNKLYTTHDVRSIPEAIANFQVFGLALDKIPIFGALKKIYGAFADMPTFGLARVQVPIFAAISIYVSYNFVALYGIAVAAVATIATRLAIDACCPIINNAARIAEMTDGRARDHAVNTTAAIGKLFAIESAALVSIALFGAFKSRAAISPVDTATLKFPIGFSVGMVLPHWFSAMTMKSVERAGLKMGQLVFTKHFRNYEGDKHVEISTDAAMRGIIPSFTVVMLTPLFVGTFFGVEMLYGLLAGSLGSAEFAISAFSNCRAWAKAREYGMACVLEHAKTLGPEELMSRGASDREDTTGDPQEDASGPRLNNLIQLMAVESLVFAPFFTTHGGLLFKIF